MTRKIIVNTILSAFLCIILIISSCYAVVEYHASDKVYEDANAIPATEYVLLLGTTPHTRYGKGINRFFTYRIDAAEALYKAGKVKRIIISGDENSLDGINEPECMRDSLIARGVPSEALILDGKGYSTLHSVLRASKVFNAKSFTVISQEFHNERALYLANHLDIEVEQALAFNAKSPTSKLAMITYAREYLARVKVFLDIMKNKLNMDEVPLD